MDAGRPNLLAFRYELNSGNDSIRTDLQTRLPLERKFRWEKRAVGRVAAVLRVFHDIERTRARRRHRWGVQVGVALDADFLERAVDAKRSRQPSSLPFSDVAGILIQRCSSHSSYRTQDAPRSLPSTSYP